MSQTVLSGALCSHNRQWAQTEILEYPCKHKKNFGEIQNVTVHGSEHSDPAEPALSRQVGLYDLHKSFPTSAFL